MILRVAVAVIAGVILTTAVSARELTASEKGVVATALANGFLDPSSAQFTWTSWEEQGEGDRTVYYCGKVNAKGADGQYGGYVPYLAAVFVKSGEIVDAVLIGTNFPSPARHGSPMRQCMGKV
jgi:hypothetical protein